MTREPIEERLAKVRERVRKAAERARRDPSAVDVLPVTKGHAAATVERVAAAGFRRIGENRVGEAESKQEELGGRAGVAWHMIGNLQRNKARRALARFEVIESVDRLKLARTLSRIAEEEAREDVPILVQVNASGEAAKSGFAPEKLVEGVRRICELPALRVEGLMTMAPFTSDEAVLRETFRTVRQLSERCVEEVADYEGRVLSMGMSNDFEIAIEEGSTRVRLGTVLVGER